MRTKFDSRGGFTLVEMIAVILIMAILIGVVITGLNSARENAWRTRARDSARQLVDAWNLYLLDNRSFPAESELGGRSGGLGFPATIKALAPLRPETGVRYIELSFDEAYDRKGGSDEAELSGVGGESTEKSGRDIAMADRWGKPICFELDFDLDGFSDAPAVMVPGKGKKKEGKGAIKANAVAWSWGPPARKGKKWVAAWK